MSLRVVLILERTFPLICDSLDGAASATSSEPVVLPDETHRRASLSAAPLQSCSASRHTIKPHPRHRRHDSKQLQLMCGTAVAAVNKLTQQENKKKTKKKKEQNTQQTGNLVKQNRAALTADECRTSQGSSFLWPSEEIMVWKFFLG